MDIAQDMKKRMPFAALLGIELKGRVRCTLVAGQLVYESR